MVGCTNSYGNLTQIVVLEKMYFLYQKKHGAKAGDGVAALSLMLRVWRGEGRQEDKCMVGCTNSYGNLMQTVVLEKTLFL